MAKVNFSMKSVRKRKNQRKRFDTGKLQDPHYANEFESRIRRCFDPILNLDGGIDELYEQFKNGTNAVTQDVIGFVRRKFVEDMPVNVIKACENRRKARLEF